MKKSLWDGDLAEYERGKSQLMRNKFKKINKLKPALKADYEMKGLFATLGNALQRGGEEKRGGESIYKPGSVEDSHSSTTTIAGRL